MQSKNNSTPGWMSGIIIGGTLWLAPLILVLSGCTVDSPVASNPAVVDVTFDMRPLHAMNGKITVHEAYLKLDRIEVSGMLGGKVNAAVTHSIAAEEPPFKLSQSDSSRLSLIVPAREYDHLGVRLFPSNQAYELVLLGNTGTGETPAPAPSQNADDNDNGNAGNGDSNESEDNDDVGSGEDNVDEDPSQNEEPPQDEEDDRGDQDSGDQEDDDPQEDQDKEEPSDNQSQNEGHDHEDQGEKNDKHNKGDKKDKDNKDKKDKKDKKDDDKENEKHHKGDDDRDEHHGPGHNDDHKHHGNHEDQDGDDDDDDDKGRTTADAPGEAVDLDNFFQNAKPGLVIFATYENDGRTISLIFVAAALEEIAITGMQNDAASVQLTTQNKARITIDPDKLFTQLNPADIESGRTQDYQQQEVLFIHPHHNTALYEAIIPQIESAVRFEVSATTPQ